MGVCTERLPVILSVLSHPLQGKAVMVNRATFINGLLFVAFLDTLLYVCLSISWWNTGVFVYLQVLGNRKNLAIIRTCDYTNNNFWGNLFYLYWKYWVIFDCLELLQTCVKTNFSILSKQVFSMGFSCTNLLRLFTISIFSLLDIGWSSSCTSFFVEVKDLFVFRATFLLSNTWSAEKCDKFVQVSSLKEKTWLFFSFEKQASINKKVMYSLRNLANIRTHLQIYEHFYLVK